MTLYMARGAARHALAYAVAVAVVAMALGIKVAFASLGQDHPFVLLAAAVIVATWYGGGGPGLLAATLASLSADVLFLPPAGLGTTPSDLSALLVQLVEAFVIVFVTDSLRDARQQAASLAVEADRARRAATFSLSVRDELIGLWTQKLDGPLAHVRDTSQRARDAIASGDAEATRRSLEALEADIELLQRTATAAMSSRPDH